MSGGKPFTCDGFRQDFCSFARAEQLHVWAILVGGDVTQAGLLAKLDKQGSAAALAAAKTPPKSASKWLVIASGKGGTTKTTTTLNLATIAAASGLRVGLLDMDEQETLTKWCQ